MDRNYREPPFVDLLISKGQIRDQPDDQIKKAWICFLTMGAILLSLGGLLIFILACALLAGVANSGLRKPSTIENLVCGILMLSPIFLTLAGCNFYRGVFYLRKHCPSINVLSFGYFCAAAPIAIYIPFFTKQF